MSYPVTVGLVYQVTFPLGGTIPITCTIPGRAGFKGTNPKGKEVTVRSYKMVAGLESFVAPAAEKPVRQLTLNAEVVVSSGRGTKKVVVTSQQGASFTDLDGKVWPVARVKDSPVAPLPVRPVVKPKFVPPEKSAVLNGYRVNWTTGKYVVTDVYEDEQPVTVLESAQKVLEFFKGGVVD